MGNCKMYLKYSLQNFNIVNVKPNSLTNHELSDSRLRDLRSSDHGKVGQIY